MNTNYAFSEAFKNFWDFNQLFSTQRRNIEALAAVNQTVVEGAQAVSRRQAEVARDNVENVLRASKDMLSGGSPESSIAKHAELTRAIFENTLANLREVTEMVTKSGFEAFDVLNKRAAESLEEIGRASNGSGSSKKNK